MSPRPPAPPPDDPLVVPELPPDEREAREVLRAAPDLSALPVAGITRRRLGFAAGALVGAWLLLLFARQVGDAAAATARVEAMAQGNAVLADRLSDLEREAELIQRQAWVVQQARGHRLGEPGEIPFALGEAGPLPADAPGSAAASLGAVEAPDRTPLESWLSLLFGPSR